MTDRGMLRLSTSPANDWHIIGNYTSHIRIAFGQELNTLGGDGLVHMGAKMWLVFCCTYICGGCVLGKIVEVSRLRWCVMLLSGVVTASLLRAIKCLAASSGEHGTSSFAPWGYAPPRRP